MDKANAIEGLRGRILAAHAGTKAKLAPNIARGHLRSISTDIEDAIALFVADLIPQGCSIMLDPSVHVGGKNNRPDMLVVRPDGSVAAMVEIKANMGWCRNASEVIDDIVENDSKFKKEGTLYCEFSNEPDAKVSYGDGVALFLVSLVDGNGPQKKHDLNKDYARSKGVRQLNLFSGWYDSLTALEADAFADGLLAAI